MNEEGSRPSEMLGTARRARGPRQASVSAQELVALYYRLVDADDIAGLVALFEPEAKYDRPGAGQIVGRAALERFYRSQEPIASRAHTISTIVCEGRHVAAHGQAVRVLLDSSTATIAFADFFTLSSAGLFAYRKTFFFVPFS
jgi:steroid Delta-isomerase